MSDTDTLPLHLAAGEGNIPEIRRLLAAGMDIEGRTGDGSTPLHYAGYYAQPESVSELLALGANINAQSKNGTTPYMMLSGAGIPPPYRHFLMLEQM